MQNVLNLFAGIIEGLKDEGIPMFDRILVKAPLNFTYFW
jgi:hypothetical protein